MLIRVYDKWLNPEAITYLNDYDYDDDARDRIVTRINFHGGIYIEIKGRSKMLVAEEINREIRRAKDKGEI